MTDHDKHMEVYAAAILDTLQEFAKLFVAAADAKDWASTPAITMTRSNLQNIMEAPDAITALRNRIIPDEPDPGEKYLKLYKDSEDLRKKCLRVLGVMCADKGVDEDDWETINTWSVIRDASGNVLVTVDYWGGDGELATYQFPVAWLDLSRKELSELKCGVQLQ